MDEDLELLRLQALARQRQAAAQQTQPLNLRRQEGETPEAYRARIEAARAATAGQDIRSPGAREMDAQAMEAMDVRSTNELPRVPLVDTVLRPVVQGATLGFGDELAARVASISPSVTYDQALAYERAALDRNREENPIGSTALEIGGAILPAVAYSPAMAGAGLLRQGAVMGGIGAAEGALYGFGSGEGGFDERLQNAGRNALLGGVVGGLAPAAIAGVRASLAPIAGAVRSAFGIGSQGRAADAVARALARSGLTEDQVRAAMQQAADEGQGMFTLADALGNPGQRALTGVVRSPGEGRTIASEFLTNRQMGQADRLGGFVDDALGLSDDTARQVLADAIPERRAAAAVNYPAADAAASAVNLDDALSLLDDALRGVDQGNVRPTSIQGILDRYRSMLQMPDSALPQGANRAVLSDYDSILGIKQQISDDIGAALRAGRNQEASALIPLRQALDRALETASPLYRQANDTFALQSRAIDAVDAGRLTARQAGRTEDALDTYRALSPTGGTGVQAPGGPVGLQSIPSEQYGFRVGFGDQMMVRPENITPTSDSLARFQTPRVNALMAEMSENPELWANRLARERTMMTTFRNALTGSMTADNIADQADVVGNVGIIANLLANRPGAALSQVATRVGNAATGMDEATRAVIARALLSTDPEQALQPLLRNALISAQQQRAAEALARFGGYQALANGG